jgi:hypothetical protein
MGRRRYNKPVLQTTTHLSLEALEFIEKRKYSKTEPNHRVLDRMLSEYENQKQRIEELEFINLQLKDSLNESRGMRIKLERQLENVPLTNIIK